MSHTHAYWYTHPGQIERKDDSSERRTVSMQANANNACVAGPLPGGCGRASLFLVPAIRCKCWASVDPVRHCASALLPAPPSFLPSSSFFHTRSQNNTRVGFACVYSIQLPLFSSLSLARAPSIRAMRVSYVLLQSMPSGCSSLVNPVYHGPDLVYALIVVQVASRTNREGVLVYIACDLRGIQPLLSAFAGQTPTLEDPNIGKTWRLKGARGVETEDEAGDAKKSQSEHAEDGEDDPSAPAIAWKHILQKKLSHRLEKAPFYIQATSIRIISKEELALNRECGHLCLVQNQGYVREKGASCE